MTTEHMSHYRILNQLGAAGMGEVSRARDTKLERPALQNYSTQLYQNVGANNEYTLS
ncbi:MAG TPA: hypothetical protein VLE20_15735 [Blastocatellia bacterium]|nr:hypothetical protein [Blastocatellia bacterium]